MLLTAVLALTTLLHPPAQVKQHRYSVGPWRISVGHDKFTDAIRCTLRTHTMRYLNHTLIFHLRTGLETTHAFYKVDDGDAHPVSEAFHEVEALGFFPRRGWIDDPAGGDVALPASYFGDAHRVWIRASPRQRPTVFKVDRFSDALDRAQSAGCTDPSFRPTS